MRPHAASAVLAVVLFAGPGCRPDERAEPGAEPAQEALPPATVGPAVTGYDPDTLAWFREGRPIEFGGREWRPVGRPFLQSRDAFRPVGEFEGMTLYAAENDPPPYTHLFFPLGAETWQTLQPDGTP